MRDKARVAATILAQLGGGRFIAMVGARDFTYEQNALIFRLPGRFARGGINLVRIALDPSDTYTATAYRLTRDYDLRVVDEAAGLFAEDLRPWFTRVTGLDTRL